MLTRNGVGKPTEDFDWKFDEIHSEVGQRSKTEATWAQTTQYRPAIFFFFFFQIILVCIILYKKIEYLDLFLQYLGMLDEE